VWWIGWWWWWWVKRTWNLKRPTFWPNIRTGVNYSAIVVQVRKNGSRNRQQQSIHGMNNLYRRDIDAYHIRYCFRTSVPVQQFPTSIQFPWRCFAPSFTSLVPLVTVFDIEDTLRYHIPLCSYNVINGVFDTALFIPFRSKLLFFPFVTIANITYTRTHGRT